MTEQDVKYREIEGLLWSKEKQIRESDGVAKRLASTERRQEGTIDLQGLKEAELRRDLKRKELTLTTLQENYRKQQDEFSVEREELGDQLAQMVKNISSMRLETSLRASEREKLEEGQTRLQGEKDVLVKTYEDRIEIDNNNYRQHHTQVSDR